MLNDSIKNGDLENLLNESAFNSTNPVNGLQGAAGMTQSTND